MEYNTSSGSFLNRLTRILTERYGIDIEKLKKASSEAVIEAEEKTKEEKKKALEPIKFEWP